MKRIAVIALGLSIASAAHAQAPDSASTPPEPLKHEYRLSNAEISKILEESERRQRSLGEEGREIPRIYGEVGFEAGTSGYRSVFGTIEHPGPGPGGASLWFDVGRGGDPYLPQPNRLPNR